MNNINGFHGGPSEPTLAEMVESEARTMYAKLGPISLAARRHEEVMYVGLSYLNEVVGKGQEPRPLKPSDVAYVDPYAVAEEIDRPAGPDGKAKIARTVEVLIQHARKVLEAPASGHEAPPMTTLSQRPDLPTDPTPASETSGQEFPLDAYCAVYGWIDDWSAEASDPELRRIALAASKSLHAVGEVVLATMRSMKKNKRRAGL